VLPADPWPLLFPVFSHRQREVETILLRLGNDLAVEVEAGHILRAFSEISQPLLPIGRKTPISMSELLCLDRM
jgi:hypothetical protein